MRDVLGSCIYVPAFVFVSSACLPGPPEPVIVIFTLVNYISFVPFCLFFVLGQAKQQRDRRSHHSGKEKGHRLGQPRLLHGEGNNPPDVQHDRPLHTRFFLCTCSERNHTRFAAAFRQFVFSAKPIRRWFCGIFCPCVKKPR